jgi:uncharacterized membrane protein
MRPGRCDHATRNPEVLLSHGNQNPTSADETPHTGPDGRVRQPNPGSITAAEADTVADNPSGQHHDRGGLEEYRPGPSSGDDQREPNPGEAVASEPEAVLEALEVQLKRGQWSGPLPPPAALYQYEQVQAGLAERIVAMAETMATGEIKTRDKLADAEIERARSGQALAFLLTIVALGAAIYFFAASNPVAGCALLSFPVIMLIRSFLIGLHREGSVDRRPDDDAAGSS